MKRRRILFVLEFYHPHIGGVETLFRNLAEALVRDGHEVTVLTSRLPGTPRRETLGGVAVRRVSVPPVGRRYLFTLLAIPHALRLARAADLVHTTTYNAALPAWLAAAFWGKPAVITVHEVFARQWLQLEGLHPLVGGAFRILEWGALSLPFDRYLCDSGFTRRRLVHFLRIPPGRTAVAYPAIDYDFWADPRHAPRPLRAELGLPEGTLVYLYFGRPGISKGVEYLVRAAHRVRREVPSSHLVLLLARDPAGPYRRLLRALDAPELKNHTTVLDPVPREELPGYLLAADCVVVPSVSEGFGYAAAEAATLGCRVIATSGHAVEEILQGHVTLVPPRDPEALAGAVVAAAGTPHPSGKPPARFDMAGALRQVVDSYRQFGAFRRDEGGG